MDEVEALRQAVSQMIKGEVIVLFYEKLKPIQRLLEEFAAQPVTVLPPMPPVTSPEAARQGEPRPKRSFPARRIGRGSIPLSPPA